MNSGSKKIRVLVFTLAALTSTSVYAAPDSAALADFNVAAVQDGVPILVDRPSQQNATSTTAIGAGSPSGGGSANHFSLNLKQTQGVLQIGDKNIDCIKHEYSLSACQTDSAGNPASCQDEKDAPKHEVGTAVPVQPGTYEIVYAGSSTFVTITAGYQTSLGLRRIRIGEAQNSSVSFSVNADVTDPNMQEAKLETTYANYKHTSRYDLCSPNFIFPSISQDPLNQAVCKALESGDPHQILNNFLKFNADGTISEWNLALKQWVDRTKDLLIGKGHSGDAVCVLPGTYRVELSNTRTGEKSSVTGIKAD